MHIPPYLWQNWRTQFTPHPLQMLCVPIGLPHWGEMSASGDLLRDGAGVLPTGRNMHALDPVKMHTRARMY